MTAPGPVFVVGAPRTGTTLVKEILNRHARVHLFDEVHFFERIWDEREQIGDLAQSSGQTAAVTKLHEIVSSFGSDQDIAEALKTREFRRRLADEGGGYRGLLAALLKTGADRNAADVWGDSSPQDILYLEQILEWFPEARIVALVRDPRGFLSSYKNYYRRQVASYRERYNPLTNSLLWRSYMTALREARERPWKSAVHVLRYEDLVSAPEPEVRRLCEHVGVEFDFAMTEVARSNTSFVEDSTSGTGIVPTSKDRWRTELSPTEIWVVERICRHVMRELDYEPARAGRPSPFELLGILAILPGRLFNMLFRSHKPFTMSKVRRVLSHLRPATGPPQDRRS